MEYIFVNISTKDKKKVLDKVSDGLGLKWKVEIVGGEETEEEEEEESVNNVGSGEAVMFIGTDKRELPGVGLMMTGEVRSSGTLRTGDTVVVGNQKETTIERILLDGTVVEEASSGVEVKIVLKGLTEKDVKNDMTVRKA